jgi:peptidyl-prolyl cis-trans isomerase B (cyclophilin B)
MKKLLNPSLALCATLFFAAAHAPAQKRPATTKVTPPPAQVKPTPTPAPTPVPTPAPEPFDGASVERMAAQCVRLETEAGTIEMKMLPTGAPETVRNFLNLAATGAFDTTTFSRVVRGFVIQGGNLSTREKLTPALAERARRTVPDEPNAVRHTRGVVSMARSDRPHSATTNFFILVGTASHLDNKFAAFGRVTKGMDVVDAINKAALEGETPLTPVRVASAAVFACAPDTPGAQN